MATVSFRSLFLIALIAAMFPVHGYRLYKIPDWFKSERVPKTVLGIARSNTCALSTRATAWQATGSQ